MASPKLSFLIGLLYYSSFEYIDKLYLFGCFVRFSKLSYLLNSSQTIAVTAAVNDVNNQ